MVVYDSMISNGLMEYFIYKHHAKYMYYGNGDVYLDLNCYLGSCNFSESEQVVKNLKAFNVRSSEVAKKIYDESKISNYVSYAQVSSDLIIAVKSMFILSSSKANPSKVMVERVNRILRDWSEDFKTRAAPTDEICRKSVYLSVFCPDFLRKHENSVLVAISKTKGGKRVLDEVNKNLKSALKKGSLERAKRKIGLFFGTRIERKAIY